MRVSATAYCRYAAFGLHRPGLMSPMPFSRVMLSPSAGVSHASAPELEAPTLPGKRPAKRIVGQSWSTKANVFARGNSEFVKPVSIRSCSNLIFRAPQPGSAMEAANPLSCITRLAPDLIRLRETTAVPSVAERNRGDSNRLSNGSCRIASPALPAGPAGRLYGTS